MKRKRLWLLGAAGLVALFFLRRFDPVPVSGQADSSNLIQNPGFETPGRPVPSGWYFDQKNSRKGQVISDTQNPRSGTTKLTLRPSASNTDDSALLAIGQAIPIDRIRGKQLRFSAWLSGAEGATAISGVYGLRKNGSFALKEELESDPNAQTWVHRETSIQIPSSPDIAAVLVLCSVRGTTGWASFDDLVLGTGGPAASREPAGSTTVVPGPLRGTIEVEASHPLRKIPRTLYGTNLEWVYDGYGIWDTRRNAPDPAIVKLARDAKPSLLRFPGGFFADFYHWRDGIGPRNTRPKRQHYPKGSSSVNNFGTDEVIELARMLGADLQFIANIITGTPEEAAQWAEYSKSDGRPGVRYWEIGNESYGKEGSAYSEAAALTPKDYAERYLKFAAALRRADPSAKLLAIGGENYGRYNVVVQKNWNPEVLTRAGSQIDLLAVHNAYYPLAFGADDADVPTVYRSLLAEPVLIRQNLQTLSDQIDRFVPEPRRGEVKLAVTEWGPFFHTDLKSPLVDHVKTMGSAVYVASVLCAFIDTPKMAVANFFKLVDPLFMGWIGKRKDEWAAKAPLLAFSLFTNHFGETLVESRSTSPGYSVAPWALVDRVQNVEYLESASSLSADGSKLFILAINKDLRRELTASISIKGFGPVRSARLFTLAGTGVDAHTGTEMQTGFMARAARQSADSENPRIQQGSPSEIRLTDLDLGHPGATFSRALPPLSVSVVELTK